MIYFECLRITLKKNFVLPCPVIFSKNLYLDLAVSRSVQSISLCDKKSSWKKQVHNTRWYTVKKDIELKVEKCNILRKYRIKAKQHINRGAYDEYVLFVRLSMRLLTGRWKHDHWSTPADTCFFPDMSIKEGLSS